jgi:glucose/arabinose dehydrogenase/uncharacterized cupredoxin-like copper-binding protein
MSRVKLLLAVVLVLTVAGGGFLGNRSPGAAQEATPVLPPTLNQGQSGGPGGGAVQPGGTLPSNPAVQLVKVADGLADPINVAAPDDGSGRLFVIERPGFIRIIDKDGNLLPDPFLDLSVLVQSDYLEQGVLGLAFHPDYKTNGRFYVNFTDFHTNGDTFVMEFHVSGDDPNVADRESGRLLLSFDQPYVNHNGGTIKFGPDGFLYIASGDGGGGGDAYDNAQDRSTLLGKLLRIDVEPAGDQPYGIPADNPFAEAQVVQSNQITDVIGETEGLNLEAANYHPDARREIWAFGLRNPWQFDFDPDSGDLYIADVGQFTWQEIDYQAADAGGGQNYGWDWLEASHCYPASVEDCPRAQVGVLPVAEYRQGADGCAIVGMGVYRGDEFPALDGIYFSSDFCSGKVWGLQRGGDDTWIYQQLLDTDLQVTGSGRDEAGNLYLTACAACTYNARYYDPIENQQGSFWRLVAADQVPEGAETAPLAAEEVATLTAGGATPSATTTTASPAGSEGEAVAVEEAEYYVKPAQTTFAVGQPYTFTVTNAGNDAHEFVIEPAGEVDEPLEGEVNGKDVESEIEDIAPGQTKTLTWTFAEPGRYQFACHLPGHFESGMVVEVEVTG